MRNLYLCCLLLQWDLYVIILFIIICIFHRAQVTYRCADIIIKYWLISGVRVCVLQNGLILKLSLKGQKKLGLLI